MSTITISVSKAQAEALRRSLRTDHAVLSEQLRRVRSDKADAHGVACTATLLAHVNKLLDQLSQWTSAQRTITGDYPRLRAAACDAALTAAAQLTCATYRHWNGRPDVVSVQQGRDAAVWMVALLEVIDEAARRAYASDPSPVDE